MSSRQRLSIMMFAMAVSILAPAGRIPGLAAGAQHTAPSRVETIAGTNERRVILTQQAVDRLDIQTGQVSLDPAGKKIAPYMAVFYSPAGKTWVYTNPEPLSFVRKEVTIEFIKGEKAYLSAGPVDGTKVVTVGASELYGVERGIGH